MYDIRRVEELIARWENGERSAEMRKVRNEVFDVLTLRTLYKLMEQKYIVRLENVISTGKEANVFRAVDPSGEYVAVKIYRVETSEFRHMWKYLDGDPRFFRVKRNRRSIIRVWAKKEYKNLEACFRAGASVPYPIISRDNVLVMEFVGENGIPAPRLKDVTPDDVDGFVDTLLDSLGRMYFRAGIVHADLSEYNILIRQDRPVIIDLGQGVPWEHPMSLEFFRRDIERLRAMLSDLGKEYTVKELLTILETRGKGDG
ncbi:MAG: kinase 1 [Candidatus Diapherotrites archaeon]|nr:kinase 1 [Candidatus Diapherotrites archaeon]MDN5366698.1 kinase 1 [Candidatus Diapherotrites archaeon]